MRSIEAGIGLFLVRKYNKMKAAFLFDQELHPDKEKIVLPR
jgi:hypothetical protein